MELYNLFLRCITITYLKTGKSANYAIERENDTLYIYFEDSNGKEDWKSNFNFPVKPYAKMCDSVWYAHRGFLGVWKELEPKISTEISDKSIRTIKITGYSHGAAIALLCYEYACFHRKDIRESIYGYGFGCPRVLWNPSKACRKTRFNNFTVIRNIDDIVTHLPPAILGYRHVGNMLEIGEKGKYSSVSAHLAENILQELELYNEKQSSSAKGQK